MRIVFSGGGTGGHIYPAIAVAVTLKKQYPGAQIMFIGARGKMEMEKVPKAGFSIKGLWISGFQRKLTWRNLLFPAKVAVSGVQARRILGRYKPDAVIGFGGYASGATVWMAAQMGIPTVIQEQNSYPGVTNKLLGSKVDKVCIGYQESARFFEKAKNVIWTGNPVRSELQDAIATEKARAMMNLERDKKTVLVLGGSLGARSINEALKWSFDLWKDEENIQIVWQCGKLYYDDYRYCNMANLPFVHIMPFIDDMRLAYYAADVVVSRAGALTVSELAICRKPAVLVPSPNVAEDHQTKNAMTLVEKRAAILLHDNEVGKRLHELLKSLIRDDDQLRQLSRQIEGFGKPDAVERITDELVGLLKSK